MSQTQQLRHALEEFFGARFGKSGDVEVKIIDDLILLRCKGAVSAAEADIGTMKAGRLLLHEMSERLCQELQPDLSRFLRQITGRRLLDISVGIFLRRREKIYILTMSSRVKH
ncbi:MAG: Na-translocating system protein MpsC family protein [Candidatus Binatia bacterium]